jgi:hypothetical protein
MQHLGFKSDSGLSKFLRRDLSRSLGRPANDRGDAAAIFEQTPLVLRLEAHISETGEMQHRPEAIGSIREIVARDGSARSRIETAENHVQTLSEDIRFITDQINLLLELPCRRACWQPLPGPRKHRNSDQLTVLAVFDDDFHIFRQRFGRGEKADVGHIEMRLGCLRICECSTREEWTPLLATLLFVAKVQWFGGVIWRQQAITASRRL